MTRGALVGIPDGEMPAHPAFAWLRAAYGSEDIKDLLVTAAFLRLAEEGRLVKQVVIALHAYLCAHPVAANAADWAAAAEVDELRTRRSEAAPVKARVLGAFSAMAGSPASVSCMLHPALSPGEEETLDTIARGGFDPVEASAAADSADPSWPRWHTPRPSWKRPRARMTKSRTPARSRSARTATCCTVTWMVGSVAWDAPASLT